MGETTNRPSSNRHTHAEIEQMHHVIRMLACATFLGAVLGCRATELAYDQDHIRSAVMELQTNQIMDNLIRYRNGLPILQLDYLHMTGTVTDTASGTLSGSQTVAGTKSLTGPTTALAFSRVLTNVFNWNVLGMKVNQLTVTAEPVNTVPTVYQAYVSYMENEKNLFEAPEPPPPGSFVVSRSYAACGGAVCRHWMHHPAYYYWVPIEAKEDFLRLAIEAVAIRGQPMPASSNYDSITIIEFLDPLPEDKDDFRVHFRIDKTLPNGEGYMIATLQGSKIDNLSLLKIHPDDSVYKDTATFGPLKKNQLTDTFILEFTLSDLKRLNSSISIKDISGLASGSQGTTPPAGPAVPAPALGGAPPAGAASAAAGGSKRVTIHLNNFAPDNYPPMNPAIADIQNLLRLQYLNGLRTPGANP
jgi:hypothetical protein